MLAKPKYFAAHNDGSVVSSSMSSGQYSIKLFSFPVKRKEVIFTLRVILAALLLASAALVGTGFGECLEVTEKGKNGPERVTSVCSEDHSYMFSAQDWTSLADNKILGQFFVLLIAIADLFYVVFSIVYYLILFKRNYCMEKVLAGCSCLCCLLCACLEAWYASGFGWKLEERRMEVKLTAIIGWAIASAFLFLCSILFGIDTVLAHLWDSKLHPPETSV